MSLAWTTVPAPGPLGALTVAVADDGAVAHVGFEGHRPGAAARVEAATERLGEELVTDPDRTAPVARQLAEYLAGRRTSFDVTIDWRPTGGRGRTVLQTLFAEVGYGRTIAYGELAERSGAFGAGWSAARGVGAIMGANPVPVIVPCHRVLAAAPGNRLALGGFGGGREAKEWLLALEGVLTPSLDLG